MKLGIEIKIPLFILFRALGVETDEQILNLIIYNNDTLEQKTKMIELLRDTIKDSEPIYTQKAAFKFLALNIKQKEIINVIEVLKNNFLPRIELIRKQTGLFEPTAEQTSAGARTGSALHPGIPARKTSCASRWYLTMRS